MAAHETTIFKQAGESSPETRIVFLKTVVEEILEKNDLHCSIFHPRDFYEREKPFFAKTFSYFAEENQQERFLGWLSGGNILNRFNTNLCASSALPKGITKPQFEEFMGLRNREKIIDYLLGKAELISYAVQEDLLTDLESKKLVVDAYITSFCAKSNLDSDIFKDYENLSHSSAAELKSDSSSSSYLGDVDISRPKFQQPNPLTEKKKEELVKCRAVLQKRGEELIEEKSRLHHVIREFCKENQIDRKILETYAQQLDTDKEKVSIQESSADAAEEISFPTSIHEATVYVKRLLELNSAITPLKAMNTWQFIAKYESLVQELSKEFNIGYRTAREAIAICGHGLTNPYFNPISRKQFENLVHQEENAFENIKQEIYYRVAEKQINALQQGPSVLLLAKVILRLEIIKTIIELASYDSHLFNGEKIDYSFNFKPKEKYIPPLLYHYYRAIDNFIKTANPGENSVILKNFEAQIIPFVAQFAKESGSVHFQWHRKFLTELYTLAVTHISAPQISSTQSQSSFFNISSSSSSSQAQGEPSKGQGNDPSPSSATLTSTPRNSNS